MKVRFNIEYATRWGESIWIYGSSPELGSWNKESAIPLAYISTTEWGVDIEIETEGEIQYHFLVKGNGMITREEWGDWHTLTVGKKQSYIVNQLWQNAPEQKHLYSTAFRNSFFYHKPQSVSWFKKKNVIVLEVLCPYVDRNQELILMGESDYLGDWRIDKALKLTPTSYGKWSIVLDGARLQNAVAYELAVYDKVQKEIIHRDEVEGRILDKLDNGNTVIRFDTIAYRWSDMKWKAAGVAIPVFSLRTKDSSGIGEFSDLKLMVDWAVETGLSVVQVLPVNDTTSTHTWADSYPYRAISIYALHPLYLGLKDYPLKDKVVHSRYKKEFKRLNKLEAVDYESVDKLKWEYFGLLYQDMGKVTLKEADYISFVDENKKWLLPYACFCYLRDKYKTGVINDWKGYEAFSESVKNKLLKDDKAIEVIHFYYFIQYLLHKQLLDAKEYAHQQGVILKGDIPIGVDRDSVDVWIEPHLFNLDVSAGAPPDAFAINGQNWGFPTYNWSEMAKDGYQWWINRFKKMNDYFEAYRIDHILGFFRIWEIPDSSVHALLGYFNSAMPLAISEIRDAGLNFDEGRMAQPYIHKEALESTFENNAAEVEAKYLDILSDNRYRLKAICDTQIKIEVLFEKRTDEKSNAIRDGLYRLCNEVLFVKDKNDSDKYHPAISAPRTHSYSHLNENEKKAFDNLYNHYFYERHNEFWRDEAMKKLPPLISATDMLVCGEDLGMIPASVASVMSDLQILSLEIERMPKRTHLLFEDLSNLPYLSVSSTSTHDMSPIRLWWHEDRNVVQYYYNEILNHEGEAPADCTESLCRQIIHLQMISTAMLVVIPFQDWLSIEQQYCIAQPERERINVPSNPNHHWQYRMCPYLEDVIEAGSLNQKIQDLLKQRQKL